MVALLVLSLGAAVVGSGTVPAAAKPSDNERARQHWVKLFDQTDDLAIQCAQTDNTPQLCESEDYPYTAFGGERLKLIITASAQHCSVVRFLIFEWPLSLQQPRLVGTTRWLRPGESATFDEVYREATGLAIVAEGREGGCNEGRLLGWAATVRYIVYERVRR
jgi:hypothetical protein